VRILRDFGEFVSDQLILYAFTTFIFFTTVVSLPGGISDVVYASRALAAQDLRVRGAAERGDAFVREDYTADTVTGAAQFVLLACTVLLGIRLLKRKTGRTGFVPLASATTISAFVFLCPRMSIGTASGSMPEVHAFLTFPGIVNLSCYHGLLKQEDGQTGAQHG
jgi:hypothetical protein